MVLLLPHIQSRSSGGLDDEKKKELSKKLSRWLNVMGSLNEGKGYEPIIRVTDDTGYVEVEGPFSVVGDWMYDWFVDNDHIHGFNVEQVEDDFYR